MLRKRDYETELSRKVGELRKNADHTLDELNIIGKGMPIKVMQNPYLLVDFCVKNNLSTKDAMTILMWVVSQFDFLNDIKVSGDVSYDKAVKYYDVVRTHTIILHRVNYILHELMIAVYDLLGDRVRFGAKKAMNVSEKIWEEYIVGKRTSIDRPSWYALQDYLRLTDDTMKPLLEGVYEAVRDNMIAKRMTDIELRARCVMVFLMGKVAKVSFERFFQDFMDETGVDYSGCFVLDDMEKMTDGFSVFCKTIGLRVRKDDYWTLDDYTPEDNMRFRTAWKKFMNALKDDNLMDETSKKAIGLNPEIQKDYERVLREEEQKEVERLNEKYKVTRL